MQQIKRIIVATDTSEKLTDEVRVGAELAKITGAQLDILHVLERMEENYGISSDMAMDNIVNRASTALEAVIDGINATLHVSYGSPFEEISTFADANKCDVIVVNVAAYEGRHGGDSMELGILAKRLAHKLPHDMCFVRDGFDGHYTNIAVATDFSDCAEDALLRACELAKAAGITKLPVIHAYDVPPDYYRTGHSEEETLKLIVGYAEKHFTEWLSKIDTKGVQIERILVRGRPALTIAQYAKDHKCDLIVAGTHGRTASAAVLLGNVAERIIRYSPCSVWAERTDGQALSFGKAIARLMGISS